MDLRVARITGKAQRIAVIIGVSLLKQYKQESGVWSAQSYELRRFPRVSAVKKHFTTALESRVSKKSGEWPNGIFINKEPFLHVKDF